MPAQLPATQHLPPTAMPQQQPPARQPTDSQMEAASSQQLPPSPQLLYRGCRVVLQTPEGDLCLPAAVSRTVVWVAGPGCADLQLTEDGRTIATNRVFVRGGCRLKRTEQSTRTKFTLAVTRPSTNETLWHIGVDRSHPELLERTDRMQRRAIEDLAIVDAELRRTEVGQEQDPPAIRIDKAYSRAVALRRLGNNDEALSALADTHELAMQAGFRSIATLTNYDANDILSDAGLPDEGALVVETAKSTSLAQLGFDQIALAVHQGRIAYAVENLQDAARWFKLAVENAERVDNGDDRGTVLPNLAELLIDLDKPEEARGLLNEMVDSAAQLPDCQKANRLANLGWIQNKLMEDSSRRTPLSVPGATDSSQLFLQSLALRGQCPDSVFLAYTYSGLAHAAFRAGQISDTVAYIKKARETPGLEQVEQMRLLELQSRIALREGKADESMSRLTELAALSGRFPNIKRSLFQCKIAVGLREALKASTGQAPPVPSEVQACTSQSSKLGAPDRRVLQQRAKETGQPM